MYFELERDGVRFLISDKTFPEFEYLQTLAKNLDAKKAIKDSSDEYFMCALIDEEPAYSATAVNGGKYPSNILRCCTKIFAHPKFTKKTPISFFKKMYLTTCNILIDSDIEGLKKYDFYFISRNPGETINKPLFPKQPGWINDDNNLYLVGKNPEEAYSWRYIYYKGNIEHFKQPKMTMAEYKEKFKQYMFNRDWTGPAKENSIHLFKKYAAPKRVLEIGTFEGRYSLWLADNYKDIEIHTIDPFDAGVYGIDETYFEQIEKNWRENLSLCKDKNSIHFYKDTSLNVLVDLLSKKEKFDFIYIDGHHMASAVLEDLVLSFNLLNANGIILIDDAAGWKFKNYVTNEISDDITLTPRPAVDAFINTNWHRIEVLELPRSNQVAIRKIK